MIDEKNLIDVLNNWIKEATHIERDILVDVVGVIEEQPFFCTWNALAPEDKVMAWQPLPEPWEGEE